MFNYLLQGIAPMMGEDGRYKTNTKTEEGVTKAWRESFDKNLNLCVSPRHDKVKGES